MRSFFLTWLLCTMIAAPARAEDVLVFAAASLAGPLDAVVADFERDTGHGVSVSYGGSSTLARQIEAGAPADLVLLANEDWMDQLENAALLEPETRRALLSNCLVLIGADGAAASFDTLAQDIGSERLALALTDAVPAGIYARAALEAQGHWDDVRAQVIETDNVRAALQLVALGAARYGIVYATDTAQEPRVTVLSEIPEATHPAITYPVALTPRGGEAAEALLQALTGPAARAIFTEAGFGVVAE
ncbi:molybdate ABC transporter substrate-binding protein [Gymnodinialimonas ceratoperidinii]|uniref:Molybdate-binding protein ModA n=1 Tax=Gymnodinialimonas ceratoperidinii TaxID=2856823 RepID=A0A8F6TU31_9RHOB|nr:molybdate ABC transporter substrate-binding protein [Gymnodinialimonas ceratoperidinii]QXT38488.1 molybdate ABC transporter substrate-binding protein [Gymnodinialimonas ceratoperidinii]